jgi:hypothetical protein
MIPIVYQVDRIRDGRSFTTRRVVAIQRGDAIFNLQASFQRPEDGLEHQIPMPPAPDPESLPTFKERVGPVLAVAPPELRRWLVRERPIDVRHVTPTNRWRRTGRRTSWSGFAPMAAFDAPLLLHQLWSPYASDMTLMDTATLPRSPGGTTASDGEPRSCAVVPPRLSRRQMAAVRPGGPSPAAAGDSRPATLHAAAPWSRRAGRPDSPPARPRGWVLDRVAW